MSSKSRDRVLRLATVLHMFFSIDFSILGSLGSSIGNLSTDSIYGCIEAGSDSGHFDWHGARRLHLTIRNRNLQAVEGVLEFSGLKKCMKCLAILVWQCYRGLRCLTCRLQGLSALSHWVQADTANRFSVHKHHSAFQSLWLFICCTSGMHLFSYPQGPTLQAIGYAKLLLQCC